MKNRLHNNAAAMVVIAFFFTLAGIGWLARAEMDVILFQKQFDLSTWGVLFVSIGFALAAWLGLEQADELEQSKRWKPAAPGKYYGQSTGIKSKYPNLSQAEPSQRA